MNSLVEFDGCCEECGEERKLYKYKGKLVCYECFCPEYVPAYRKPGSSMLGKAQEKSLGVVGINRRWRKSYRKRKQA